MRQARGGGDCKERCEHDGLDTGFAVFLPGNFTTSDFLSSYSNVFLFVGEHWTTGTDEGRSDLTLPPSKSFTTAGGRYQTSQLQASGRLSYQVNSRLQMATARGKALLSLGMNLFPKRRLLSVQHSSDDHHTGREKVVIVSFMPSQTRWIINITES